MAEGAEGAEGAGGLAILSSKYSCRRQVPETYPGTAPSSKSHLSSHPSRFHPHRQSVCRDDVKEMASHKSSLPSLIQKTLALTIAGFIAKSHPQTRITLRWCPGHSGIKGNEIVDRLANTAAKKKLPPGHVDQPSFSSFRAAIKVWARESSDIYSDQDIKRLGHKPQSSKHLKALIALPNKHSIASITQL